MIDRLRAALLPFAVTRAALLVVGLLAAHLLASGLALQKGNLVFHRAGPAPFEIWARWDAEWYLLIAEHGYRSAAFFERLPVGYAAADATGFFPAFPLLIRALGLFGIVPLTAGVLLSNAALLLALLILCDLVRQEHGDAAASSFAWILLAFPTSLFLSAVYAESLMLLGVAGAFRAARQGRPWTAGLWAALATLSRPTGVLVILPLADELFFASRPRGERETAARLGGLLLPLAGLGAYMAWCHALFGEWAPFLLRQARWRGPTSGPWRAFARWAESPRVHDAHHSTIDLVVALILVASIPFLFRSLRRSWAIYAAAAILLPLGSTLWSFSRFAAAIFPFHALLAARSAAAPRFLPAYLALSLPVAGLFMALYAAWWWVG